jgi:hypothetical protein
LQEKDNLFGYNICNNWKEHEEWSNLLMYQDL